MQNRENQRVGPFQHLSQKARDESLQRTLAHAPTPEQIDLFVYGSLIWRPDFCVESQQPCVLSGYERRFCIYTVEARGTPEKPGLGLGLIPAQGLCEGVLLRLPSNPCIRDNILHKLWQRELLTDIYQPHWLRVQTRELSVPALAFVVNTSHPQYAGQMTLQQQVKLIQQANGKLGSCRAYLENTVKSLAAVGIVDLSLNRLLERLQDSC